MTVLGAPVAATAGPMSEPSVREWRAAVRRFVRERVTPFVAAWDDAEEFPWELFQEMGRLGYLGIGVAEEYGGSPGTLFHVVALAEELSKCGGLSVASSVIPHAYMVGPYLNALGTPAQKRRFLAPAVRGEEMLAIALTEPDHGSDLAALETRAVPVDVGWRLTGQKIFTSSARRASTLVVAARTTPGAGYAGISLFLVRADDPGFAMGRRLRKMGLHALDTNITTYDDVLLPADRLLGPRDQGFIEVMRTIRHERLLLAAMALAGAEWCLEQAIAYARQRHVFGAPMTHLQVVRHQIVDMATRVEIAQQFAYHVTALLERGDECATEVAMLKAHGCETAFAVANEALQLFGGYGYIADFPIERVVRDLRMFPIGGGATAVQREIIAKQMGLDRPEGPR